MSGLTSGAPEPGIRTYNPQVRVGNWNEDICLEEDLLRGTYFLIFYPHAVVFDLNNLDFLARKANGTLLIQKKAKLRDTYLSPVELTESTDGFVHFGDTVMVNSRIFSSKFEIFIF